MKLREKLIELNILPCVRGKKVKSEHNDQIDLFTQLIEKINIFIYKYNRYKY